MTAKLSTPIECSICGSWMQSAGTRHSSFSDRDFDLAHCTECGYSCVVSPRTDFQNIYNHDYYDGKGADPLVDYRSESHTGTTVRLYEWRGILDVVSGLTTLTPGTRWLDFGCGLGGLVSFLHDQGLPEAVGFDEGFAAEQLDRRGVPRVTDQQLDERPGTFDVITAIEVIEHIADPLPVLRRLSSLLAPGGLVFLTTGNAAQNPDLTKWSYVIPDIHVAFFEPRTLSKAFEMVGLMVEPCTQRRRGWSDIIRYKILKSIRVKRRGRLESLVPWGIVTRFVDIRRKVSAHPVGRAPIPDAMR